MEKKTGTKTPIIVFVLIIVVVAGILGYINNNSVDYSVQTEHPQIDVPQDKDVVRADVKGAVNNPGVYRLEESSTVDDAINAAGGATEDADLYSINRAEVLKDGAEVIVPYKTDMTKADIYRDIISQDPDSDMDDISTYTGD